MVLLEEEIESGEQTQDTHNWRFFWPIHTYFNLKPLFLLFKKNYGEKEKFSVASSC